MPKQFDDVFDRLREILKKHAKNLSVAKDNKNHYCLEAPVGPTTIKVWRGKLRSSTIPVAWVRISKAYVSYHLMGVYGLPQLLDGVSEELRTRMQGKSCFNFKIVDAELFDELAKLTAASIKGMEKAGIIAK